MRLSPETVKRVEDLQEEIGVDEKVEVVARSVALAEWWAEKRRQGAEIYAEHPDGSREFVRIGPMST